MNEQYRSSHLNDFETDPLLTPEEVAAKYHVARGTLANRRCLGTGPAYIRTPGRRILYRESAVVEWLSAEMVAA